MRLKVEWAHAARPVRLGLLAPVVMAALVACGGDGGNQGLLFVPLLPPSDASTPVVAKAKKTVLIYLNGSDLESGVRPDGNGGFARAGGGMAATNNIHEMLQARFGADVNVVLETGGTKKEGWDTLRRQQIKDQKLVELEAPANPNASMADPATLSDFIEWGTRTFPAEQYVLFFWNHGGGPNGGFGADQINAYNGSPSMSVANIQVALERSVAAMGQKFELIGFDACLMASLEIASALSGVGHYLAASSDIEPGPGWNYQAILSYLAHRPDATGEQLGRRIADSYVAKNESKDVRDLTFSITDLRRVPALQEAVDQVFGSFSAAIRREGVGAWANLAAARAKSLDFYSDIYKGQNSTDLVDLGSLLRASSLSSLQVESLLTKARGALDDAVVFKRWGDAMDSMSGLTVYFPALTLRLASAQNDYQTKSTASAALKQFNLDYVNYVLDGHVPQPTVGQPTVQPGGALYSALSSQLYESGYGVLQDPSGGIISTQVAERTAGGLALPAPNRWPTLQNLPILMATEFDPSNEGSSYVVPALRSEDCEPFDEVVPVQRAGGVGFLVVQKEGQGEAARYRVAGYHGHTGSSSHGYASRLMPVNNGSCFAFPQFRFDADNVLHYEFTTSRFAQFNTEADREIVFTARDLSAHRIYTAVSDYTGQLLFSPAPAVY